MFTLSRMFSARAAAHTNALELERPAATGMKPWKWIINPLNDVLPDHSMRPLNPHKTYSYQAGGLFGSFLILQKIFKLQSRLFYFILFAFHWENSKILKKTFFENFQKIWWKFPRKFFKYLEDLLNVIW